MDMAIEFSARIGLCPQQEATSVQSHLKTLSMPMRADMGALLSDPNALLSHMRQDKKNEGGQITLILAHGIGQSFIAKGTSETDLLAYLQHIATDA